MATTIPRTSPTLTPWGRATLVERASILQRVGDKRFSSVFELLETKDGETLLRIAYTTGGATRRGPVTLRTRDLQRLREALRKTPGLAAALDLGGDA